MLHINVVKKNSRVNRESEEIFSIGDRLRAERERLGLTQKQVAGLVCTTPRTLVKWEANETSPSARDLFVMDGIGYNIHYVVTGDDQVLRLEATAPGTINPEDDLLIALREFGLDSADADIVLKMACRLMTKI